MEVRNTELRKMGSYISKYRVENLIAAGTFGRVYLATLNGKRYAIKEMAEPVKASHRSQMENEIKVLADLNHDNIVKLYEVIREGGLVHLVMEYC
jgi:NIMA (never in mitosis gene a)-related kinase